VPPRDPGDTQRLITAYQRRVEYAAANRMAENDLGTKIAALRASGAFGEARQLFDVALTTGDTNATDPGVRRLNALNALSLYDQDLNKAAIALDTAVSEFSQLLNETEGAARLENVLSLAQALFDKSEQADPDQGAGDEALDQIVALTGEWLKVYRRQRDPFAWARLKLARAQALQIQGERAKYDIPALRKAVVQYEAALGVFESDKSADAVTRTDVTRDAKSGLAAALQVLGDTASDEAQLRRAVALHREVVGLSSGNARSAEAAGPLRNLAGSLVSLASHVAAAEAAALYAAARVAVEQAVGIYEEEGDAVAADDAGQLLTEIDSIVQDC
jgi:tetratricopeptide (TPR) repeat protein